MSKDNSALGKALYGVLHPFLMLRLFAAWAVTGLLFGKGSGRGPLPPNTIEAYQALFPGNLHGHWDTIEYSACPGDTAVSFLKEGKGYFCAGAYGFLRGSIPFLWRQTGEFEIELSETDEGPWIKVEYSFFQLDGKVKIFFDVNENAGDEAEWVYELTWDSIPLVSL